MSKIIFSDMHAEYHPPKPSYEALKQENEQLKAGFMPQLEEALKDKNYYRDAAERINKINMKNSEIAFNAMQENEQQAKRIKELEEALKESLRYFDHNKNIMNPEEGWKKRMEIENLLNTGT